MIPLDSLEQHFLGHVRGGSVFPREWCAQGLVDSDIGLSIYANAYGSRLREALENDHPVLARYLGDNLWAEFCNGYIEAHPSRVRSLRHFGAQGPAWLGSQSPFSEHPEISELAAFERGLLDVFDAADAQRLDWSVMQSLDAAVWPDLRLHFHPSLRLLPMQTNAVQIWRALKDENRPPEVSDAPAPAHLLWRDEERVTRFRPADAVELAALDACLLDAQNFASLCERLAQSQPVDEVPTLAVGFLRRWFEEGIISRLDTAAGQ
ncbi:MAG TPA: DNA-binding domain-containing protein [Dokdonella sp.]|uniref:DNA-binding domain-containing protein n=1 Tax=Dokdonella sp. TaxID=2291710 RepID=UPI002D7FB5FD|nr:DNA-binding domain-containing protein [Dokdonella sp.]HET9031561.1 DNA-binding domain-containing protein [Dokdonella sp.]